MTAASYSGILNVCTRHAERMEWAMQMMSDRLPLTPDKLSALPEMDLAILDQFSTRFSKLQNAMGGQVVPGRARADEGAE